MTASIRNFRAGMEGTVYTGDIQLDGSDVVICAIV